MSDLENFEKHLFRYEHSSKQPYENASWGWENPFHLKGAEEALQLSWHCCVISAGKFSRQACSFSPSHHIVHNMASKTRLAGCGGGRGRLQRWKEAMVTKKGASVFLAKWQNYKSHVNSTTVFCTVEFVKNQLNNKSIDHKSLQQRK